MFLLILDTISDSVFLQNDINQPGGLPLLAFNGNSQNWALCPNNTANGRLDVVFSPTLNHPHYTVASCLAVDIQMLGL